MLLRLLGVAGNPINGIGFEPVDDRSMRVTVGDRTDTIDVWTGSLLALLAVRELAETAVIVLDVATKRVSRSAIEPILKAWRDEDIVRADRWQANGDPRGEALAHAMLLPDKRPYLNENGLFDHRAIWSPFRVDVMGEPDPGWWDIVGGALEVTAPTGEPDFFF